MACSYSYVPYEETGSFSRLVTDYLGNRSEIQPFYRYRPDEQGLAQAIEERDEYKTDRKVLADVLERQYAGLTKTERTEANIRSLRSENTFTICTAHQPNLLTGYLYFIYKILHAIKLAEHLNQQYHNKHFVPVYYMGSEDNDLEELGTFRFRGTKYTWDGDGQTGAVGRMSTRGLKAVLADVFKMFGPPGKNYDDLEKIITTAYLKHATIAAATQYLVNELFGKYGLVVLDPDDAELKRTFIPVMRDELLHGHTYGIVNKQIEQLGAHYKIQAHPRPLNLFYLANQLRERIEHNNGQWEVVDTDIRFSEQEILKELDEHPERFSPNVMLRGLYQETILPNVAFIGGGAEVAYWLQLKTLFEHYGIAYPCIFLRQSVTWVMPPEARLLSQLEFSTAEIFQTLHELTVSYISKHTTNEWRTDGEAAEIEKIFASLQNKATSVDASLKEGAAAALTKMKYQLQVLEKKMLRAEKKKMDTQVQRIERLKNVLFPNGGLQERVENFMELYLEQGPGFTDVIKDGIDPQRQQFLVIECTA